MDRAKKEAKATTRLGVEPGTKMPGANSTTLNLAWAKWGVPTNLPERVGKHSSASTQLYQGNIRSSYTMDFCGKKPAFWPSSEQGKLG